MTMTKIDQNCISI